jgi:drug/metabolite transporter (DMT)-like permease
MGAVEGQGSVSSVNSLILAKPGRVLEGIAWSVVAVAFFAASDTIAKFVTSTVSVLVALWFRYAIQSVVMTALMLPKRGMQAFKTAHPKFQVLRGLLLVTTTLLAFSSLQFMPVGEFTAIVLITPLVITLLAGRLLGEVVSPLRWVLVLGGFVGAMVIIRPGHEAFHWTALLPLALVGTNAWFQVLTSKLAKTEDPMTMQLYSGWTGAIVATVALPFVWTSLPSTEHLVLLVVMACMVTAGHFMLTLAYQRAPATALTPYFYLQICFAMLGGWVVFTHVPDAWVISGMALIGICGVAGGWLTVHEDRKIGSRKIADKQIIIEPIE